MSTKAEKIRAQKMALEDKPTKPWHRHMIGPVELEALFAMRDALERIAAQREDHPRCGRKRRMDKAPHSLFHVTTGRKAKLYRQTGRINAPVRGFDTLMAAMAWAMKTGRKVIMRVEPVTTPQLLPDHHNEYGHAWWTDSVPMSRVKCTYSAEGAWTHPDAANGRGERPGPKDA